MVNVNMEVVAKDGGNGAVAFEMQPLAGSDPYNPSKGLLRFPKGSPRYDIKFLLRDETNLGLRFAGSAEEAIWIEPGLTCPPGPQQAGNGGGEFDLGPVTSKQLSITNHNRTAGDLTFKLRFQGRDQSWHEYDPVIQNGGGGGSGASSYAVYAAVATVIVIAGCVVLLD